MFERLHEAPYHIEHTIATETLNAKLCFREHLSGNDYDDETCDCGSESSSEWGGDGMIDWGVMSVDDMSTHSEDSDSSGTTDGSSYVLVDDDTDAISSANGSPLQTLTTG